VSKAIGCYATGRGDGYGCGLMMVVMVVMVVTVVMRYLDTGNYRPGEET